MTTDRPRVLLVTFQLLPAGEARGELLVRELAARGIDAEWVSWDDANVDWAAADLIAVRSAWDYHRRLPAFLAWAVGAAAHTPMLNGPEVFAWNAVKDYLVELGQRVPAVPTLPLDDTNFLEVLSDALARWGRVVVKPATGAGGVGLVIVDALDDVRLEHLTAGPWVAQPLLESISTHGETSVFVLGQRPVVQVDKLPAAGEVRVHGQYGGRSRAVPLSTEIDAIARRAVRAGEELLGRTLDYARVDLLWHEGAWVVSELELIEPGLYLEVEPATAAGFAALVLDRLRTASSNEI